MPTTSAGLLLASAVESRSAFIERTGTTAGGGSPFLEPRGSARQVPEKYPRHTRASERSAPAAVPRLRSGRSTIAPVARRGLGARFARPRRNRASCKRQAASKAQRSSRKRSLPGTIVDLLIGDVVPLSISTRLRPFAFARYRAASARRSQSSGPRSTEQSISATPTLIVRTPRSSGMTIPRFSTIERTRSIVRSPSASDCSGRSTTNSSPP